MGAQATTQRTWLSMKRRLASPTSTGIPSDAREWRSPFYRDGRRRSSFWRNEPHRENLTEPSCRHCPGTHHSFRVPECRTNPCGRTRERLIPLRTGDRFTIHPHLRWGDLRDGTQWSAGVLPAHPLYVHIGRGTAGPGTLGRGTSQQATRQSFRRHIDHNGHTVGGNLWRRHQSGRMDSKPTSRSTRSHHGINTSGPRWVLDTVPVRPAPGKSSSEQLPMGKPAVPLSTKQQLQGILGQGLQRGIVAQSRHGKSFSHIRYQQQRLVCRDDRTRQLTTRQLNQCVFGSGKIDVWRQQRRCSTPSTSSHHPSSSKTGLLGRHRTSHDPTETPASKWKRPTV